MTCKEVGTACFMAVSHKLSAGIVEDANPLPPCYDRRVRCIAAFGAHFGILHLHDFWSPARFTLEECVSGECS